MDELKSEKAPDLYQKITDESTFLGQIASKIPGFSGYVERSRRREADQLLRQTIAGRLEAARLQLSAVHQELSRDIIKAMEYAEQLGRIDSRLMGLVGKVKDAPVGYAGFFDAVKINADDLANIYAFDTAMMAYTEQIVGEIATLETAARAGGDVNTLLMSLDGAVREAVATFNSRHELLSGAV